MLPKYEGFIMHEGPSQNIVLYNFANLLEDISTLLTHSNLLEDILFESVNVSHP